MNANPVKHFHSMVGRIRVMALFGSGVSQMFLLWFEVTVAKTH